MYRVIARAFLAALLLLNLSAALSRSSSEQAAMPSTSTTQEFKDGLINFDYEGETFQTYYKLFGTLEDRAHVPVIAIHGGPGLVHNFMLPFSELALKYGTPTILYDQLGNGKSTHVKGKDPTFWTIDLFLDELVNLIKHFGIEGEFDVVGHSWGGILATEFILRRKPAGLRRVILTDTLASMALWNKSTTELLQTFPDWVQKGVIDGLKDPEKYEEALKEFHGRHGCNLKPWPKDWVEGFKSVFGSQADLTVSEAPILKDWTAIDRLQLINIPTLLINGKDDISQDWVIQPFFDRVPKIKWVTFQNSSHTPFFEEPEAYFKLVANFLDVPDY